MFFGSGFYCLSILLKSSQDYVVKTLIPQILDVDYIDGQAR